MTFIVSIKPNWTNGVWTIAPEENCPPPQLGFGFGLASGFGLGLGGNFPLGNCPRTEQTIKEYKGKNIKKISV